MSVPPGLTSGRGLNTQAHMHSLETGHHVYINLRTLKVTDNGSPVRRVGLGWGIPISDEWFPACCVRLSEQFYCLPDNYEIKDTSLEDIRVSPGQALLLLAPWSDRSALGCHADHVAIVSCARAAVLLPARLHQENGRVVG